MITVTADAAAYIKDLVPAQERATQGLRLFIDKGGCSGLSYGMKIQARQQDDTVIDCGEVKVFVDPESSGLLADCTLDYEDSLTSTGFRIHNPRAKQTCGCGTSFEP